ncbi:hypothetical protein BD413DRAFT_612501 [Trametes elegans]|nr:hypothetical protein BD413DRAFT_612501 [Trametes elegans]
MNQMHKVTVVQNRKHFERSLALVRTFRNPPSTHWRHINDFPHVLFTLRAFDREQLMLVDEVTDADWTRFQAYVGRVHDLRTGTIARVHPSVFMALAQRIRNLELKTGAKSERCAVRMVVRAAQAAFAHATSLVLEELEVGNATALDLDAINSLAAFPQLQRLQLKLKSVESVGDGERIAGFGNLPDLEILACGLCAYNFGLSRLGGVLARLPRTLRQIRAKFTCSCNGTHFGNHKTLFDPLHALGELRTLSLAFDGDSFVLEDRELRDVVDALPEPMNTRRVPP